MLTFLAVLAAAVVALLGVQELDVECDSRPARRPAAIKLFASSDDHLRGLGQTH